MQTSEIRSKFREVLEGDTCVHPGSVFDPISARIAEDLGFEFDWTSEKAMSTSRSMFKDAGSLAKEFLRQWKEN